jgi:hypothetical protein
LRGFVAENIGHDNRTHVLLTMQALNRNRYFPPGFRMRGVHAVILCWLAAPALSGCIRSSAPVAAVQAPRDVDSIAYGQSYGEAPASAAMAYAAAPAAVGYDRAYKLDASSVITMPLIGSVPLGTSMSPGDTVRPGERWF